MKEKSSMHERLAERLACILTKLNMGLRLSTKELARDFSVSTRTISRDFDRMGSHLPLLQDENDKRFYLDPSYLSKIRTQDTHCFAELSGAGHLYPLADIPLLRAMLDQQTLQVFSARGYVYEAAEQYAVLLQTFSHAIQQHQQITFLFKAEMRTVQPYKLVHQYGCWYLAAVDEGRLQGYELKHISISEQATLNTVFEPDSVVLAMLKSEKHEWLKQETFEVEIKVVAELANYFRQTSLLPAQCIKEELSDGCLLLTTHIGHAKQVLPLVQFWMPGLSIVQPESLKQELKESLERYLQYPS